MSFDRSKGRTISAVCPTSWPLGIMRSEVPGPEPRYAAAYALMAFRERDLLPDDAPYYPEWGTDLSDFEDV